jgi:hypothetical protein
MTLKNVFASLVCAVLLGWSGQSVAEEHRPGEFFGLDLSTAVLSPQPLGPPSYFEPVPIEAQADRGGGSAQASAEPKPEPKSAEPKAGPKKATAKVAIHKPRAVHARAEKPRPAARTKLARRHGNPLDAQAFDPRIQVWPCRSGGICNWKR